MAEPLVVEPLTADEAVAFLMKRTGRKDKRGAVTLAKELGGFPLALEHAAAFVEASGMSFSDYGRLFLERQGEVWGRRGRITKYPGEAAVAWNLAFTRVQDEAPPAAEFLNLCALLAPHDITYGLLKEDAAYYPTALECAVKVARPPRPRGPSCVRRGA